MAVSAPSAVSNPKRIPRNGALVGWSMVALLTLVHILSYVDRMLPLLLIEKIKHSLDLSDLQLGVLMGPAFATCYILFAIPLGWLVDRGSRTVLLSVAILFWSAMTAVAGVASTFSLLFVSRLGVGLAEACLSPCALSLISDYVPRALRTRAVAIFQTGSTTGSFVAMAGGGWLASVLEDRPRLFLPGFGQFQAWQEMFLISATLGIPLALILFMVRDSRLSAVAPSAQEVSEAIGLGGYLRSCPMPFACLLLSGIGYTALGNLAAWSVAVFTRLWHWDVARAGFASGSISLAGALTGALLAVLISGRRGGQTARPFDAIIAGLTVGTVSIAGFAQMPSATASAILYFFGLMGMATAVTGAMTVLTLAVPHAIRGKVAAIYFFCVTLVGVAVMQPIVGAVSDRHGLPAAITGCALFFGIISIVAACAGRKRTHAMIAANELEEAGEQTV